MALAVPSLLVGWAFAICTAYFIAGYALGPPPTDDHPSEVAGWFLMFIFGVTATATLIAPRHSAAHPNHQRPNHMTGHIVKSAAFALLGLMIFGFLTGCTTVPPTSERIDVSSKTIAYFLRPGQGPTVVFQSGLGDGKTVWGKVIERMPKSASIFAYDRPGYGDSPGVSETRDPCVISRELHELLGRVGLAPPYVLVGHSLGGLYQFYYAKLFPEEVAGLVLLDPTHPNHWEKMNKDTVVQAAIVRGLRITAFNRVMRQEFDAQAGCAAALDMGRPLALPTRLLFSGQFQLVDKGAFEKMARALREQWLTLFSDVQRSEVSGSGHYIQKEAPGAVVKAIQSVIDLSKVSTPAASDAVNSDGKSGP